MKINKNTILSIILIIFIGLTTYFSWQIFKFNKSLVVENQDFYPSEVVIEDYLFPQTPNTQYLSLYNFSVKIEKISDTTGKELLNEGELICEESDPLLSTNNRTKIIKKEDKNYCLKAFSEGAAGSIYTEYELSYLKDENLYTLSYLAVFPQCYNYPEEQMLECQEERENFFLEDYIINSINVD